MHDTALRNLQWADALIDGLIATGVRRAVFSPGSRSTPLILALERRTEMRCWHHPDERSASFFALGLARHNHQPVALIATSGSAPAHWYPAVIEANRAAIPLLLLSADRPPELHDCGANQTVDQSHLFGSQVRAFHDPGPAQRGAEALHFIRSLAIKASQQSRWPNPGPVHINLPFREPLVPQQIPAPSTPGEAQPWSPPRLLPDPQQINRISTHISGKPGLILCGPDQERAGFPEAVTTLATRLDCPILADPLSQLRFGEHDRSRVCCHYDAFLRRNRFSRSHQPQWLLRFGAAPVSGALLNYLAQTEPTTLLCSPRGDWPDPLHQSREMIRADATALCEALSQTSLTPAPADWLETFVRAEQQAATCRLPAEKIPFEDQLIQQLIDWLPAGSTLFSSNSLPIRQLDSFSGSGSKRLRIFANRGASGIDGNVSTLLGLMAASETPVVGLLGDLALFHDMNGLLAARDLQGVIILLNNGGCAIFGQLPQAGLEQFEAHWLMPTGLDFSHSARLYGLNFQRVTRQAEFRPALEQAIQANGVSLIEVVLNRSLSLQRQHDYWQTVARD